MNHRVLLLALLITACQPVSIPSTPVTTAAVPVSWNATIPPSGDIIDLPVPQLKGNLSLEETLAQRRSVRAFADTPLTLAELGQLLWAAQGITDSSGQRTAPSAGALYPLEIYVATHEGAYHYDPASHRLTIRSRGDVMRPLYDAALQQGAVIDAPAVFVIAADYARTSPKYGDRAPRYVQLEAGHAAQNILLQATALHLAAVPMGAFEDARVKQALALSTNHDPLYLIPIGHPQ